MTEMFFWIHSGVRYLVLLAGLTAGSMAALAMSRPAPRGLRIAWKVFVGLLDLQVLLGLGVILTRPFQGQYIGHLVMMLAALAVAHGMGVVFRRQPADARTGRPLLMGAVVALILVVGGILAIGRPLV